MGSVGASQASVSCACNPTNAHAMCLYFVVLYLYLTLYLVPYEPKVPDLALCNDLKAAIAATDTDSHRPAYLTKLQHLTFESSHSNRICKILSDNCHDNINGILILRLIDYSKRPWINFYCE